MTRWFIHIRNLIYPDTNQFLYKHFVKNRIVNLRQTRCIKMTNPYYAQNYTKKRLKNVERKNVNNDFCIQSNKNIFPIRWTTFLSAFQLKKESVIAFFYAACICVDQQVRHFIAIILYIYKNIYEMNTKKLNVYNISKHRGTSTGMHYFFLCVIFLIMQSFKFVYISN